MRPIYFDNNATTPLLGEVADAMQSFAAEVLGNPASAHAFGRRARCMLEDAREQMAALLGALPDEVIFTSGATEANNLAIFGLASTPSHIVTSPIEHPSVAEPLRHLETMGCQIDRLPVNSQGLVTAEIADRLRQDTSLVTIQLVNQEMGALQPIGTLARQLPAAVAFHCDAVQAVGKLPVHFHELGVTTLSLSAHKFHGPVGIGALLVRRGTRLQPRTFGGHQQHGKRPGTENVALAVGLATALAIAHRDLHARHQHVSHLRSCLLQRLEAEAAPIVVNGPHDVRQASPYVVNLSFPGCQADSLLMNLDLAGVACSTGSACSSGSLLPSPVLQAMGVAEDVLRSAMRFSFSALLSEEEVLEAAGRVVNVVKRLRRAC